MGPIVTESLLDSYGLRGTLLLMAGILLQRLPLSLAIWCPQDKEKKPSKSQRSFLKGILDFSLFKRLNFSLYCLASVAAKFYFDPFVAHMPSLSVSIGTSMSQAALLPTAIFMSCLGLAFLMSFVANVVPSAHRISIYVLAAVTGCLSVVTLLVIRGYTGALVACILAGTFHGELDVGLCLFNKKSLELRTLNTYWL